MIARATVGVREMDLITASLPCSMRLAISTSPSRVSRGTVPISRRYMRTGVVGLVERARRQIQLELLGALARPVEQLVVAVGLLGVDDFDAGAAERAEQVVQLVRRRDVGGQQLVDLVVEQVALFLADGDELPHLIVFFFDRQRRVLQTLLNLHPCPSFNLANGSRRPRNRHSAYRSLRAGSMCTLPIESICCLRASCRIPSSLIGWSPPEMPCSRSRSIWRWTSARSRAGCSRRSSTTQSAATRTGGTGCAVISATRLASCGT